MKESKPNKVYLLIESGGVYMVHKQNPDGTFRRSTEFKLKQFAVFDKEKDEWIKIEK